MFLCKCGCGQKCIKNYVSGHNLKCLSEELKEKHRLSLMGHIVTKKTRKKIGDGNKGKIRSEAQKKQWSESHKKLYMNGYIHPFKGKHHKEESNKSNSIKHLGMNAGPKNHFYGKHLTPWNKDKKGIYSEETLEKIRNGRLKQIFPKKDTVIEKILQKELTKREYIYEKHYPTKGQPDIAFPGKKIAIFADGDYIHGNPKKFKPEDRVCFGRYIAQEKWDVDRLITENLQKQGWLVLRYWETEIHASIEDVVDEIEYFLYLKSFIVSI